MAVRQVTKATKQQRMRAVTLYERWRAGGMEQTIPESQAYMLTNGKIGSGLDCTDPVSLAQVALAAAVMGLR